MSNKKIKLCQDLTNENRLYLESLDQKKKEIIFLKTINWNNNNNNNKHLIFHKKSRRQFHCLLHSLNNLFQLTDDNKITPEILNFCKLLQEIQILKGVIKNYDPSLNLLFECQNCHDKKVNGNWSVDVVPHLGNILKPKFRIVNVIKLINDVDDDHGLLIQNYILENPQMKFIIEVYTEVEAKRKSYYNLYKTEDSKIENIGQLHAVSIGNGCIYDDSLQNELKLTEDNLINVLSKYQGVHTCYYIKLCRQSQSEK